MTTPPPSPTPNRAALLADLRRIPELASDTLPVVEPYLAPIDLDEIVQPLYGQGNTAKTRDYLEAAGEYQFLEECKNYEDLLGNGAVDPPQPYPLNSYYVKTESFQLLDVVFAYVARPKIKRNLTLIGPKGCGKTALQNCWLSENHQQLVDRKILWIRCDGHRLYRLWQRSGREAAAACRLVTLEEYLDMELVHVFAKHAQDASWPLVKNTFDLISKDDPQFWDPVGRDTDDAEPRYLKDRLLELKSSIDQHEGRRSNPPDYRYVDFVVEESIKSVHNRAKRRWVGIARVLYEYLHNQGIWVLRIVDGLDNVHIDNSNWSRFYDPMILQAATFLGGRPRELHLHLLAIRDPTLSDLTGRQEFPADRGEHIDKRHLAHTSTLAHDVLKRRCEFFQASPAAVPDSIFNRILSAVSDHACEDSAGRFHYNYRAYLHNRLTLVRHVYYRLLQLHKPPFNESEIRHQVRTLSTRNLLLNGRFFLNTEKDLHDLRQELGTCAINIHYYDRAIPTRDLDSWYGLSTYRLLQALQRNKPIDSGRLVSFLTECWRYPTDLVNTNITRMLELGFIDSSRKDGTVHLHATQAGEDYVFRSFTDVDTVYHSALDTVLPRDLMTLRYIRSHSNKLRDRTGYLVCSLVSSLTFLAFLTRVNHHELARAAVELAQWRRELAGSATIADVLPHETANGRAALEESIQQHLDSMNQDRDFREIGEFVDKILGRASVAASPP